MCALATLAVPPAGGVGYDLRYAVGAFVFHTPPPCNLGIATAAMLAHQMQNKYDSMINAPVAPLNPHGRFLLEAQVTAFKDAFLAAVMEQACAEGNALDTAALLLFFAVNALVAGRIFMAPPAPATYDMAQFEAVRAWLRNASVVAMPKHRVAIAVVMPIDWQKRL